MDEITTCHNTQEPFAGNLKRVRVSTPYNLFAFPLTFEFSFPTKLEKGFSHEPILSIH
jgi:hypothetical protein